MESVQTIRDRFNDLLNDKDKKKLAGYMEKLGFNDISAMFYNLKAETGKKVGSLSSSLRFRENSVLRKNLVLERIQFELNFLS